MLSRKFRFRQEVVIVTIFRRLIITKMTKNALIIASNGSEDIELTTTSDVLRRSGVNVTIAGIQDEKVIELARKVRMEVDALFKDVQGNDFDAVILPGGQPGSNNLAEDSRVGAVLQRHEKAGKIVAAICAAPIALAAHEICKGGTFTSYPSVKEKITGAGYQYSEERVCVHKNVVTSRGPGTAFDFALKISELLVGAEKAQEVRKALLLE